MARLLGSPISLIALTALLAVSVCASEGHFGSATERLSVRKLLHAGHSHDEEKAPAPAPIALPADKDFVTSLKDVRGLSPQGWIQQLVSNGSADGTSNVTAALGELFDLMRRDPSNGAVSLAASLNMNSSVDTPLFQLSAASIVQAAGGQTTFNDTLATSCLSILACQADSSCKLEAVAQTRTAVIDDSSTSSSRGAKKAETGEWLRWASAGILFVEAMLGALLPILLKLGVSAMEADVLTLLNCFAGGVFFAFGILHLAPELGDLQDGADYRGRFPVAYFLAAAGFYVVLLVDRVFRQPEPHSHAVLADHEDEKAGGKDGLEKTPRQDSAEELESQTLDLKGFPAPASGAAAARVAPAFMLAGLVVHSIFEGLALGLQSTYAATVSVLVAMASHKWVESISLAARLAKGGTGLVGVLLTLLPFALAAPVGIVIGIQVKGSNAWTELVFFALITGFFIYIGASQVVNEEFSTRRPTSFLRRVTLFCALAAGFLLVAALQFVPDS